MTYYRQNLFQYTPSHLHTGQLIVYNTKRYCIIIMIVNIVIKKKNTKHNRSKLVIKINRVLHKYSNCVLSMQEGDEKFFNDYHLHKNKMSELLRYMHFLQSKSMLTTSCPLVLSRIGGCENSDVGVDLFMCSVSSESTVTPESES